MYVDLRRSKENSTERIFSETSITSQQDVEAQGSIDDVRFPNSSPDFLDQGRVLGPNSRNPNGSTEGDRGRGIDWSYQFSKIPFTFSAKRESGFIVSDHILMRRNLRYFFSIPFFRRKSSG